MSVGTHAICNGKVVPAAQAVLPVTSREVQYGFSVYESLSIIGGRPIHLEDHIRRLDNSCKGIQLPNDIQDEVYATWLQKLIDADKIVNATVRILLVGTVPTLCFITAVPQLTYPEVYYTDGIGTITYNGERFMPECKTSNLLLNYLALRAANECDCFESLLVDHFGRVLEGTRSNFFAFRGNKLYTASDKLVLQGITRDRIIKAAALMGIEVVYEPPTQDDLLDGKYEEAFISSTSMRAMPVARIDSRIFLGPYDRTNAIRRQLLLWEEED